MDVKRITINDNRYPQKLKSIYDPPKEIYLLGNEELLNTRCISSVGARMCSQYGKEMAISIGKEAARRGVTLVSGMAKGIDYYSHMGCLMEHGNTIAVLGCGVDICYPKENIALYNTIKEEGLIISEYPLGFKPQKYTFPKRNRIISALSDAVCVVEAKIKSGSIITAECAIEQGKDVYAIPGNINSGLSLGTNKLIQDGAKIVTSISDMFFEMGINKKISDGKLTLAEEKIILLVKKEGEISIKNVARKLNIEEKEIIEIVTVLSMKGLINYEMGKIFIDFF